MDSMLTVMASHYQNPTGAVFALVSAAVTVTPADPLGTAEAQAYPLEKLHLLRQFYTKYTALAAGDRLVIGSVTYVVKAVHPWAAQGGMDAYVMAVLEKQL